MRAHGRPLRLAAVACLVVVTGCGGGERAGTAVSAADRCEGDRAVRSVAEPEGLEAPGGLRLTGVASRGAVKQAAGFVPMTPAEFIAWVDSLRTMRPVFRETEGFEAEALLTDGTIDVYWRVFAACGQGSRVAVTVTPAATNWGAGTAPG